MSGTWKISAALERTKLSAKEDDWNLHGGSSSATTSSSRTRSGRVVPGFAEVTLDCMSTSSGSDYESEESESSLVETSDDDAMEVVEEEPPKPPASRIIVEVDSLTKAFAANAKCKSCNEALAFEVKTTCIASNVILSCTSRKCGYVFHSDPPAATTLHAGTNDKRERSTDYAINVLYVLSFLSSGDGCSEAARVLELLGLPNDTTMESRSFTIIEERIGPSIRKLTQELLLENLTEEVQLTMAASNEHDADDFKIWKSSVEAGFVGDLSIRKYPLLTVSYDMAWQQRSSGHRYNSPSGHALMCGARTRKPLSLVIHRKICNFCKAYKKKNPDALFVPDHRCWKTHTGSSKAMEAQGCLDLVVDMYDNKRCIVKGIVIDDDATTKATVRWSNQDWMLNNNTNRPPRVLLKTGNEQGKYKSRPNKGKLPRHIPEPAWVHDPNHRKRVLTGDLHKLLASKVSNRFTMTKMDISRLGKNYGYMVRSLNMDMSPEDMSMAGKAVLEHHFDNHIYCGDWCRRKLQTGQQLIDSTRYYRSLTLDAVLHETLEKLLARFITLENLREVAHGLDTQMNESFNNSASWLAPKNKIYCGSGSLTNRISIALGFQSIGSEEYYKRLFKDLGITITPNIAHCLKVKGSHRDKRLMNIKTTAAKKGRIQKKYTQLKLDEQIAKKERAKRAGTYVSGINVAEGAQDGYTLEELNAAGDGNERAPSKHRARKDVVCPHCQLKGHSTKRSKHCTMNSKFGLPPPPVSAPAIQAVNDADACDKDDHFPLQDDIPSDGDMSDLEGFFDAGTWSDSDKDSTTMSVGSL
jgi:hypothetical protein